MATVTLQLDGVDGRETIRVRVSDRNRWEVLAGGTTVSDKRAGELVRLWQGLAEGKAKGYLPNRALQYAEAGLGALFGGAVVLRNTYRPRTLRRGEVH